MGRRRQILTKVQLPLARRMILLGVNQTILFALSMVVIAGLIGGGGLGAVVNSGLFTTPSLAILAGVVIVVMAIALDRSTEAIADRTDPRAAPRRGGAAPPQPADARGRDRDRRGGGDRRSCRRRGVYRRPAPEAVASRRRRGSSRASRACSTRVQDPTSWVFSITEPTATFILQKLLLPLQGVPRRGPWFTTLLGLTLIAFVVSGLRPAITTFVMLGAIGVTGVWALAMDTLSRCSSRRCSRS